MQEVSAMTVSHGKPYAGNLHVRFDEGADVPDEGRLALLHQLNVSRRDAERPRAQRMLGILRIQQICNFLSILCLSAPLREKNSPPTAVFRVNAGSSHGMKGSVESPIC